MLLSILAVLGSASLLPSVSASSCSYESFRNPPAANRARFRYWVPDGNVDIDAVRRDVRSAAAVGAGGVEFLPFFEYGGIALPAPEGVDWSTGAFGNHNFNELFKAALKEHKATGMLMDFALGPNQGQGIPSSVDNEGLQWDLIPHMTDIQFGDKFDGQIPGWGTGKLVSVVSAKVLDASNTTIETPKSNFTPASNVTVESMTIQHSSLKEISHKVSRDGKIKLSFQDQKGGTKYKLFAFYEKLSGRKNVQWSAPPYNSIFNNGSFVVDHFSRGGAQAFINFWEQHILTDELKELLASSGRSGELPTFRQLVELKGLMYFASWEDSVEIESVINWSPTLLKKFSARFGYDLRPFLPLIIYRNNNNHQWESNPGIAHCVTDAEDGGLSKYNDFRAILADGYNEYNKAIADWLHTLGLKRRHQPAYNLPMDMRATIPFVDIPECEGLGFDNSVDSYKQFSGAAAISGRNIVSNEIGADSLRAFSMTIPDLLREISRAFAGGSNQFVIHGQSFSGNWVNTTWPGHVPFNFLHADAWSPKRPDWSHGLKGAIDYIGRVQEIQQKGVSRADIAVYDKPSATDQVSHPFNTTDLRQLVKAGWNYQYLSPENFALPKAHVKNNVLAPDGPRYQAILVPSTQNFTIEALKHLQKYANDGLPVILLDGTQGYYPSNGDATGKTVARFFKKFKESKNVHIVSKGEVIPTLDALNLQPYVGVKASGHWHTSWREEGGKGQGFAYVFNDGSASSGSITVQSTARPYLLDAWTGESKPLLTYTVKGDKTIIPLNLETDQSVIIAFSRKTFGRTHSPKVHLTSSSPAILGHEIQGDSHVLHVAASSSNSRASAVVSTSNGQRLKLPADSPESFSLDTWDLTAELWEAPKDFHDAAAKQSKRNVSLALNGLTSWTEIPSLVNASGIGFYSTKFALPNAQHKLGAYIKLPPALNTFTLVVNGQTVPPLNLQSPMVDVGEYLKDGENSVTVTVPSTMWNYVSTFLDDIVSGGKPTVFSMWGIPVPEKTDNGLVGTVTVIPYQKVQI